MEVATNSDKFTESEISKAMDVVEKEFEKNKTKGTVLKSITYNEKRSNQILDEFSVTLKEMYEPLNLDDFMVILLDFKTGGELDALGPNQDYYDFNNILIKEKNTWKIISGGY